MTSKAVTVLRPCRVPWMVSPDMSAITLTHTETDVSPECRVVFGGGRLQSDDRIDSRVIEITFVGCYHARVSPISDSTGLDTEGFHLLETETKGVPYLDWLTTQWRENGYCPDSSFWVAVESLWLEALSITHAKHYVLAGRDGFVEMIAGGFSWKEWLWHQGNRDAVLRTPPIEFGEAISEDTYQKS